VSVVELEIPARPSEVARVRRGIRAALVRYGLDADHADVAQLVGSELVMNAVVHGREPVRIRVSVERDSTVLEVYDGADALPTPDVAGGDHRGLQLVGSLCSDWGTVVADGGGKTVWCSIPHQADPRASRRSAPNRRAQDQAE
jgi:two-component sensor histidine kinase